MAASHFYERSGEVFGVQATEEPTVAHSLLPSPSLWREIPAPSTAASQSGDPEEGFSGLISSL